MANYIFPDSFVLEEYTCIGAWCGFGHRCQIHKETKFQEDGHGSEEETDPTKKKLILINWMAFFNLKKKGFYHIHCPFIQHPFDMQQLLSKTFSQQET